MKKLYPIIGLIVLLCLFGCTSPVNENTSTQEQPENNPSDNNVHDKSLPLLAPERVLNIAHRGASGHAPEHTMEAYQLGEEMNADYIEIDLQMTSDGTLVALHDPDLARISNEDRYVNQLTIDEVKQLDVGSWFNQQHPDLADPAFEGLTVPTLDEVITEFGEDANYYIETKQPEEDPDMVAELIDVLKRYDLIDSNIREGHVIIQSFSQDSLLEVHELEPSLPIIQLISYQTQAEITDEELEEIKEYAEGIGVNYQLISEEYVTKVRDANLLIHPYTVNEKADMKRLIDWGVTGMFTNFPDRLDEVLGE